MNKQWFTGLTNTLNSIKYFTLIAACFFLLSFGFFIFQEIEVATYFAVMSVASGVLELNRSQ